MDRSLPEALMGLGHYAHRAYTLGVNFQTYLWPSMRLTAQEKSVSFWSAHGDQASELCCINWVENYQDIEDFPVETCPPSSAFESVIYFAYLHL